MQNQVNISYGPEGLAALVQQLEENEYTSLYVLVDTNTETHCLAQFLEQTKLTPTSILTMKAGEENKHFHTCEYLWN